jgi:hypothetical protein
MPPATLVLDIDGVLNTPKTQSAGGMTNFSAAAVAAMRRLLRGADFEIVLCSSWRLDQRALLAKTLRANGLVEIIRRWRDSTPVFAADEGASRAEEIDAWLYRSRYCGRLAILDDDEPLPELRHWWLPVDHEAGLTPAIAARACQLLCTGPSYTAAD